MSNKVMGLESVLRYAEFSGSVSRFRLGTPRFSAHHGRYSGLCNLARRGHGLSPLQRLADLPANKEEVQLI